MNRFVPKNSCRLCGSGNLIQWLDLGEIPLANEFVSEPRKQDVYPLTVMACQECWHSQLSVVVDPHILFHNYPYHSSVSRPFLDHCSVLASNLSSVGKDGRFILDIGSNDGALLSRFNGFRRLGVEPSSNLATCAMESGIETLNAFWDEDTAMMVSEKYGKADYVTAFNVLGHVDDIHGFLSAVDTVLDSSGIFIVEVPHVKNILGRIEFDTAYHEHLSYFMAGPLSSAATEHHLKLVKCEELPIHGGSIRMWFSRNSYSNVDTVKIDGIENYGFCGYMNFQDKVERLKTNTINHLETCMLKNKSISGFGASAKGNVLLNYMGIGRDIVSCIYDDTKDKQHKFTPGMHIPVLPVDSLYENQPDILFVLAWNFFEAIKARTSQFTGEYFVPIHG